MEARKDEAEEDVVWGWGGVGGGGGRGEEDRGAFWARVEEQALALS